MSGTLGDDRRRTASVFVPPARNRDRARIVGTCSPRTSGQVLLAGLFAGELKLKLAKSPRKGRTRHPSTLLLAVSWNNRISISALAEL
jgi:hypothetical protein